MKDDEILILLFLHANPDSTTTEIAKNLFNDKIVEPPTGDEKQRKNKETTRLRNEDRRVRYYVDRFVSNDLVTVRTVARKQRFSLNTDNVHFGLARIEMQSFEGNEISIGLGRILLCNFGADGFEIIPIPVDETENQSESE